MFLRYIKNVSTLKYHESKCVGCGRCVEVCPHEVFTLQNRKAILRDFNACMECGACQKNCPSGALEVRAGVGCANAIIKGKLHDTPPTCGCGTDSDTAACCC